MVYFGKCAQKISLQLCPVLNRIFGGGCAVLCYPYLVSLLFADLLSIHLVTFLMFFFNLVEL